MTATAIHNPLHKALDFWDAPIGKKTVMAITGMILFGFVLVHMAGNLQVFLGPEKFDAYGRLLRVEPALLWFARIVLLGDGRDQTVGREPHLGQLARRQLDGRDHRARAHRYSPVPPSMRSEATAWMSRSRRMR